MSEDLFRYDLMVEDALRGVVRSSLIRASERGLPGNHHFYITFKTEAPGVEVPSYLKERYPEEMTIVLQYQFWNLKIGVEEFEVTLSFNDTRERLVVPFAAMTGFADPSVQFGLQFQQPDRDAEASADAAATSDGNASGGNANASNPNGDNPNGDDPDPSNPEGAPDGGGEVVSLDQFRKKK
jgi:hypothetical protein